MIVASPVPFEADNSCRTGSSSKGFFSVWDSTPAPDVSSAGIVFMSSSARCFARSDLVWLRWIRGGLGASSMERRYVHAIVPDLPFPAISRIESANFRRKRLGLHTFTMQHCHSIIRALQPESHLPCNKRQNGQWGCTVN